MIPPGAEFDPTYRPKTLGMIVASELGELATEEGRAARLDEKESERIAAIAGAAAGVAAGLGPVAEGLVGWLVFRTIRRALAAIPRPLVAAFLVLLVNGAVYAAIIWHDALLAFLAREVAALEAFVAALS